MKNETYKNNRDACSYTDILVLGQGLKSHCFVQYKSNCSRHKLKVRPPAAGAEAVFIQGPRRGRGFQPGDEAGKSNSTYLFRASLCLPVSRTVE